MSLDKVTGWIAAGVLGYLAWSWMAPPAPTSRTSTRAELREYLRESTHRDLVEHMDRYHELFGKRKPRNPWSP